MGWSNKRGADLAEDLDILLGDFCREWGFCNNLEGVSVVASQQRVSAVNFSLLVLRAEGLMPDPQSEWAIRIAKMFRDRYGDEIDEWTYRESLKR